MILLRKFRRRWNRFFYVFAVFFLAVTGGCTMFPWMPVDTSRGNMSDLGETAKKPVPRLDHDSRHGGDDGRHPGVL